MAGTYLLSYKGNLGHESESGNEVIEGKLLEDGVGFAVAAVGGPGGHFCEFGSLGFPFKLHARHFA